jgi:hypothetical protein
LQQFPAIGGLFHRIARIVSPLHESTPEGEFSVDVETFVFSEFRLIPAQRIQLNDGNPLGLGSQASAHPYRVC